MLFYVMIGSMVFVLIFGISFTMIFSNSITRPINRMTDAANRISSGKEDVEFLNIERDDEIGDLSKSFDRMINSVRMAIEVMKEKEE